jgi:hypothetical protein
MAASVANTFFWKWDQHQQDKCDLWTGVAKIVQTAVQLALLSAIPTIGFLDTEVVQKAAVKANKRRNGWHAEAFGSQVSLVRETRPWWRVTVIDPSEHLEPLAKKEPWTWTATVPYKIADKWNRYTQAPRWQTVPNVLAGSPMNVKVLPRTGDIFTSPMLTAGTSSRSQP